jgi:hypothetical protein
METKKEYFIPVQVVGAVNEKHGADPRIGKKKPSKQAAYLHILEMAYTRLLADECFRAAVVENAYRINEKDATCWQRVNLPVSDAMHGKIKRAAAVLDLRLYDFVHQLFVLGVQQFDFSQLETANTLGHEQPA